MGFLSKFPCCLAHVAFNKDMSFCSEGGGAQQVLHPLSAWGCTSAAGCGHLLPMLLVSSPHFLRVQKLKIVRGGEILTLRSIPQVEALIFQQKRRRGRSLLLCVAQPRAAPTYRCAAPRPRPASRHVGTLSSALTNGAGPRGCGWPMCE